MTQDQPMKAAADSAPMEVSRAKCTGHTGDGTPCENWPMRGGTVCHAHGGRAPQVKAAARRRLAERDAARFLHEVEIVEIEDPVAEFRALVSEAVAVKGFFAGRIAELEHLEATGGAASDAQVRGLVAAYERGVDRAGKLLDRWLSLGLEERRIELDAAKAERYGTQLLPVLVDGLAFVGLPAAQERVFRMFVSARLREVLAAESGDEAGAKVAREVMAQAEAERAQLGLGGAA